MRNDIQWHSAQRDKEGKILKSRQGDSIKHSSTSKPVPERIEEVFRGKKGESLQTWRHSSSDRGTPRFWGDVFRPTHTLLRAGGLWSAGGARSWQHTQRKQLIYGARGLGLIRIFLAAAPGPRGW